MVISMKDWVVPLSTGVTLQVTAYYPAPELNSTKLAILLHPWSWLGGDMHEPTLKVLTRLLEHKSYHVIRYNSRGVGESSGWPSLTGKAEGEDLKALVQEFLAEKPEIDSLTIIGYSHGSLIASLHPVLNPNVKTSHILLSYPLSPRGLLTMFHTGTYTSALRDLLCNPDARLLIIYGDNDEFTRKSKYDEWVDTLRRTDDLKATFDVVQVMNANHFWQSHDARIALEQAVDSWIY
ncbi:Alpha/Beta hydrolase protein [Suillus paluster]|uniref:Alpha/Beta hydrolase protein n=1 Tax=Suillus paluster TaxID=48578 RepID=UPI001B876A14|nr:Alpha/Beta hydrolase protein [Suillus paluster]KAG1747046.1 Alpha/Beta hydrolase protein [Suillus paluster]